LVTDTFHSNDWKVLEIFFFGSIISSYFIHMLTISWPGVNAMDRGDSQQEKEIPGADVPGGTGDRMEPSGSPVDVSWLVVSNMAFIFHWLIRGITPEWP
jgi:hypothetical protein